MSSKNQALKIGRTSIVLLMTALAPAPGAESLIDRSWGLLGDMGVHAPQAWAHMKTPADCSKSRIVVAVIDTGIDTDHPALKNSLWVNPVKPGPTTGKQPAAVTAAAAKPAPGAFTGDVNGWDFAENTGKLTDKHGHGTHIAGIISANEPGRDGLKGVCPGIHIMALRYYNEKASGADNLRNTIKAIDYAVDHGANIINYSGGGAEYSEPEYRALKRAEEKGILVVAAAGNEKSNADRNLYYPAAYPLSNIISVTAIDQKGKLLGSANWGITKVHVAAPGQSILSALPEGGYGFMSGTSQATAFVSGIAALLLTERPELKVADIRKIIEESSVRYPQLAGKTKTGAKVSADSALRLLASTSGRGTRPKNLAIPIARQQRTVSGAALK